MVSSMMRGAGYAGITFERFDTDICIGRNVDAAVEFAMALGPAGEIIRLAGADGERLKPEVSAALRETLARLRATTACGRHRAPGSSQPLEKRRGIFATLENLDQCRADDHAIGMPGKLGKLGCASDPESRAHRYP